MLSAFLDALTVAAVVIAVAIGFYTLYHRFASGRGYDDDHDHDDDELVADPHRGDLDRFRAFLRSLLMHAMVGTALGGLATLVGEPQNLLIGEAVGWDFGEFLIRMAPVSIPVLVDRPGDDGPRSRRTRWFGYGAELPASVREVMERWDRTQSANRSPRAAGQARRAGGDRDAPRRRPRAPCG